jgi:DNA-binding SARP family transcriptional activator
MSARRSRPWPSTRSEHRASLDRGVHDWGRLDPAIIDEAPAGYVARHRAFSVGGSIGSAERPDSSRLELATRILAEVLDLPSAEAVAALEYLSRLRRLGTADWTHHLEKDFIASFESGLRSGMQEAAPYADVELPGDDAHDARAVRSRAWLAGSHRSDPPDVAVRALGPLSVEVHGTPVRAWGGARIRTVFQYLLLRRRPVHREVLMELLWPGYPHGSARNNLNVCMYGLRRVLGTGGCQDFVVYQDGYYALNPDLDWSLDWPRFVQAAERARCAVAAGQVEIALVHARRAVDEYGGPLFEGDTVADWCTAERAAMSELFMQTLERMARLYLDWADIDGAQHALQRLLWEDGCRESAHRLLMVCYARRNQRDSIVRQFRRCTRTLKEELDVAPSDETVRLYRQLTDAS